MWNGWSWHTILSNEGLVSVIINFGFFRLRELSETAESR